MGYAFLRQLSTATRPQSVSVLAAAGVKPSTLRGKKWRATSRGHYVPAEAPQTPAQRLLAAVPLIPPTGALAGWAAAYVLGVDMLDGLDPFTMAPMPLTVSLGSAAGRVDQSQVRYVRERLLGADRALHQGPGSHGCACSTSSRRACRGRK